MSAGSEGHAAPAALTVHHIIPSSQRPELFWADENLISACQRCNYGGGARVQAENRRARTAQPEQIIESQQAMIEQLLDKLAEYENPPAPVVAQKPANPAIY